MWQTSIRIERICLDGVSESRNGHVGMAQMVRELARLLTLSPTYLINIFPFLDYVVEAPQNYVFGLIPFFPLHRLAKQPWLLF